jgi:hypothetical protein
MPVGVQLRTAGGIESHSTPQSPVAAQGIVGRTGLKLSGILPQIPPNRRYGI